MVSPVLTTTRLILRPFNEGHLTAAYVAWLNDPDVVRYSEQRHRKHSPQSCRQYLLQMQQSDNHFWAIERREGKGRHVGNLTAYVNVPNRTADLAIMVGDRSQWGTGVGAEAWIAASDFLIADAGMRKLTAGTMAENRAMLKVMEKSGMAIEAVRSRQFLLDGREVNGVYGARFAAPQDHSDV